MSENKFIQHLKGKATAGSVVEIKNQATPASFANMPSGTSNANNVYADVRGNATVVAQGTTNWKLDGASLVLASSVSGDGNDYTGVYGASGAGLWVNATYTFPSTGDPNHPVAMIFNPNTKWVLKLCGDNLLANGANTIGFSLVITISSSNIITKNFTVAEQANKFCKEFIIDFAESNQVLIKAQGTTTMQVQLLCATASATARIYNGMTVFTTLQRKVDASTVSADFANVEEILRDGILPSDYFSNAEFIDEIDDGEQAYAVFERDGDDVNLAGWTPKDDIATTTQLNDEITARENADLGLQNQINTNKNTMDGHIANTSNPHQVTKAQVGLGNVDNTSDADKPVSAAQQVALDLKADKSTTYTKTETDALLNGKQNTISDLATIRSGAALGATAVQPADLATVATSGSYNDLSDKPTIGNGTLTVQANGTTVATFGANQTANTTANITVPTDTSDLTNTAGFITSAALTPYAKSADLATVATSGSYNDLSDTPTIPTVNNPTITITQGGVTKGSFTLNQASGDTIALDAGGGGSVAIDNTTITENASQEIQAVAVVDQNSGIAKTWTGTMAEYDAIVTKDPETEYIITDDIGLPATEIGQITEDINDLKEHTVIEFQEPTAANNYTWYRKYADGWVEQGGFSSGEPRTATLAVAMADTNYSVICVQRGTTAPTAAEGSPRAGVISTTQIYVNGGATSNDVCWQVSGMAA